MALVSTPYKNSVCMPGFGKNLTAVGFSASSACCAACKACSVWVTGSPSY